MRTVQSARRGGFTLLEVMLAMALLTLGMTSILGLLTFGAALTRTAALRTTSASAVTAVIADLEEHLFPLEPDGSVGEPQPITSRAVPAAPGVVYSASATANPDGPLTAAGTPLEYRVDIELAWEAGGVERKRKYTTLLLRQVTFGERMRRRFVDEDEE
jgi:prepilin-type N-terminal cleavage/methylation domain-containing protein